MQPSFSTLARRGALALSVFAFAPLAQAQFADGFESYANGSAIEGQNGWQNWDICATGNQAYNTVTNAQAFAGTQSMRLVGGMDPACPFCSDTTHELNGPYTSGQWTMSIMTFIPSSFFGDQYLLMLNDYGNCGGPYNWSMQSHFVSSTGLVTNDLNGGANPVLLNGDQPIIFDQWVEFKAEIDLDTDLCTIYYDCVPMWEYQWSIGVSTAGGTARIACLDLFAGTDDSTEIFLDNITLSAGITGTCPVGTPYCMAATNSTGGMSAISAVGSQTAADNDITLTASNLPANSFGFFITSLTQGFVANPNGSAGNLCVLGAIGRYVGPGQIQISNNAGSFSLALDLTQTPTPTGLVSIMSQETWNFQAWHRDSGPSGPTSNFTNGVSIGFL